MFDHLFAIVIVDGRRELSSSVEYTLGRKVSKKLARSPSPLLFSLFFARNNAPIHSVSFETRSPFPGRADGFHLLARSHSTRIYLCNGATLDDNLLDSQIIGKIVSTVDNGLTSFYEITLLRNESNVN